MDLTKPALNIRPVSERRASDLFIHSLLIYSFVHSYTQTHARICPSAPHTLPGGPSYHATVLRALRSGLVLGSLASQPDLPVPGMCQRFWRTPDTALGHQECGSKCALRPEP